MPTSDLARRFTERVQSLTPEHIAQWGTLTLPRMLVHLHTTLGQALGEVETRDDSSFWTRQIVKRLALSPLPFPKARLEAHPSFLVGEVKDLDQQKQDIIAAMARLDAAHARDPTRVGINPLFGPMTTEENRRLHTKHIHHHLFQFGA